MILVSVVHVSCTQVAQIHSNVQCRRVCVENTPVEVAFVPGPLNANHATVVAATTHVNRF